MLGARGSELERSFSCGVVPQLFEPLLASERADERAGLLAGAAGLAASVFDPANVADDPVGDSSLATLHGLYWLTANLAERRPLLLAVDDLQWSDLASLRWLAYLPPRMEVWSCWWSPRCGPRHRARVRRSSARSCLTHLRQSFGRGL